MAKSEPFRINYQVNWKDLDANVHMGNTAYLDYASQTRFIYLDKLGFKPADFQKAKMGPVIFSDNIQYMKELRFLDHFYVEHWIGGKSQDDTKFLLVNKFYNANEELCALLKTHGAWFDLSSRKIISPPPPLVEAMDQLTQTDDYKTL